MNLKKKYKQIKHLWHNWREIQKMGYCGSVKIGGRWTSYIPAYIVERLHIDCKKGDVVVVSSYTAPNLLPLLRYKHKLFFTAENTHAPESAWMAYENVHRKDMGIDLHIGFDYYNEPKYIRFPYWISAMFPVQTTYQDIVEWIERYNYSTAIGRDRFCAMICRADYFDDRVVLADYVERIAPISYPSGFRHNDDSLKKDFGDKKLDYLQHFRFNLCPENTNNYGYVTEKVFEAIKAGCIPIYWGNEGMPEPEILNPDAIIYLDIKHPEMALKKIQQLVESEGEYQKFIAQPRFVPGAADVIWGYFTRLDNKLRETLKDL